MWFESAKSLMYVHVVLACMLVPASGQCVENMFGNTVFKIDLLESLEKLKH